MAKLLVLRAYKESLNSSDRTRQTTACAALLAAARTCIEEAVDNRAVREIPALSFLGEKIRLKARVSYWTEGGHGSKRPNNRTAAERQLKEFLTKKGYEPVTKNDMNEMLRIVGQMNCSDFDRYVQNLAPAVATWGTEFGDKEKKAINLCRDPNQYRQAVAELDYKNW